jgi:NAD(P)-dependent dehydrogenase (short-subunit alcohol dehydrogenase family)
MDAVDLSGKNVLITGGSLGLGFAAAQRCLEANGRVVICARDSGKVREAVEKLQVIAGREKIEGLSADVTSSEQIDGALDLLESRFGTITSLIHAAAILGPIGEFTSLAPEEWLETLRVNLFGTFVVARQACARMKKSGGRLVLFSGGGGGSALPNYTPYACSKAAVVRFAETIAQEMAPYGIEVNALAPGLVATRLLAQSVAAGQLPPTQPVPPSLAAGAAAFLISDRAAGISGKFLAAPYDSWIGWPQHVGELRDSDLFTLRRIVPRDRGMDWQ